MLKIYNSLTREKAEFKPLDPQRVRMYVCGMTVYDYCHLGHARVLVVFDVVYRYLCHIYGAENVTYVRNITDIDDRIITRAQQNAEPFDHLTQRFIDEMNRDADALGVLRPNLEPRATDYIGPIVEMVQTLVQKQFAYQGGNGDVYYDVRRFDRYGALSGRNMEDERAGARVAVDEAKRDPLDFVLWKSAKPGEPNWASPWGVGRPGWHIECSAMSTQCLGNHFDIHGGGIDLKFPHHENEIAQAEAATGEHFANVWMHNGHVMVDSEKMSKSLGNFFTVRDVLQHYAPEVVRYFTLSSHYRSPLQYTQESIDGAKSALERMYTALRGVSVGATTDLGEYGSRFYAALDDDFNTPEALAVLFDIARELNRAKQEGERSAAARFAFILGHLAQTLGLLQQTPEAFLRGVSTSGLSDAEVEALILRRTTARKDKNWAESDRVRDELKAQGIVLEDAAGGTTWRRN
ncbi:MAG: cysteine--tRNA ligase [Gammaproteobacteria bacterium]|nr:cysteine--tRNA ligase [Gammaproteobacteria bacterium]